MDLSAPPRIFSHSLRVAYAHCTLGNHVYYARYLDLLEAARGEFFRQIGSTCLALQEQDIIFQVTECSLRYLKPARYDDELTVRLSVAELRKVRFRFDCEIARGPDLLVTGWTRMVCAGTDEKPKRIPGSLLDAFKSYERREDGPAPETRPTAIPARPWSG